jgi:hypothetical protein
LLGAIGVIDEHGDFLNNRRTHTTPDFGVWVEGKQGSKEGTLLAHLALAQGNVSFYHHLASVIC